VSQSEVAVDYDRWLRGRSLTGLGYRFLATAAGSILVNTPVFRLDGELGLRPEQRLLDVGCGRAGPLQVLAARVHFRLPPVGIDVSGGMLRLALEDLARGGSPPVDLLQGSAASLPLADGRFDVVISAYLLKHLSDVDLTAFFAEIRRVLKPGGIALVWEFAPTRSHLLDGWHRWLLTRGISECHLRGYGRLSAAAIGAGFEWVERAVLRPFLFPPIPRVALILGRPPEAWRERTGLGRARQAALREAAHAPPQSR
jgi:SAM-dependent methyltransferase